MAGDKHSKTEAPTPKRKKESRKEGQVVRSEDLVTWAMVLVSTWIVPSMLSRSSEALQTVLRDMVAVARDPQVARLPVLVGKGLGEGLMAALPGLVALAVVAVVGNLAQVGFLLTGKPLQPKLSRLNPIEGIKRIFTVRSLWETVSTVLKLVVILAVAWMMVRGSAGEFLDAPRQSVQESLADLAALSLALIRGISFAALVLGLADYAIKRRQQYRDMKMSKEEVRQEARESDGDPHVKARQRQMRAQMSRNRMLASVRDADVVITNPTHLAIALRYDRAAGAPKVLARGADELAAKIREEAAEAGVPCVEAKPLARALYAVCRVGEEIPPELYQGVATVLAFLHRLGIAEGRRRALRVGLEVPDTWTPEDGELVRVSPTRRRVLDKREAVAAAEGAGSLAGR